MCVYKVFVVGCGCCTCDVFGKVVLCGTSGVCILCCMRVMYDVCVWYVEG